MSETRYGFNCLRLRAAREEHGLSVAEIADRAGISRRTVSFYLSGERYPRADMLPRLAHAVGLAEPLDLCDLPEDGEHLMHLRVRAGKSRTQAARGLDCHLSAFRMWETDARVPAWWFFDVPTPSARRKGALTVYRKTEHEAVYEVSAERVFQAWRRVRAAREAAGDRAG